MLIHTYLSHRLLAYQPPAVRASRVAAARLYISCSVVG
jgi:hypothetical protein